MSDPRINRLAGIALALRNSADALTRDAEALRTIETMLPESDVRMVLDSAPLISRILTEASSVETYVTDMRELVLGGASS